MVTAKVHPETNASIGQLKTFIIDLSKAHFFNPDTEVRIIL